MNSRYEWFRPRVDTMTPPTLARNLRDLLDQLHPNFRWNDGTKPSEKDLGDWWRSAWLLEQTWHKRWPESFAEYMREATGPDGYADPEAFLR